MTQNVEMGMREKLEALAQWMGFVSEEEADAAPAGSDGVYFFWRHGVLLTVRFRKSLGRVAGGMSVYPAQGWNPFTDANVDVAVLAQARYVWGPEWYRERKGDFRKFRAHVGHATEYRTGDYARAVLATIASPTSEVPHGG